MTGAPYYDAFRRRITPSLAVLVRDYKRTAYTCANLNSAKVVGTPLKLYLRLDRTKRNTVLEKGIHTKGVSSIKKDWLQEQPYLQKALRSFVDVEEVVVHPVLDFLDKANETPHLNGVELKEFIQLYQEVTGICYVLITNDVLGRPKSAWILPSQWVTPRKTDDKTKSIVDFYEFNVPGGSESKKYNPKDVIVFKMASLIDPYVDGLSPLQAAFESNEVNNRLLTHESSLLENEGRPDVILTHADDDAGGFGAAEAKLLETEYRMKFTKGRGGGVWVPTDPVKMLPVNFPPRDLARLEINKWSKNDLANAFQIPYALISDASHNRQQLEAAEVQHAKYGIRRRLNRNACGLNDQLLTRYDNTGRLFLAYDDPVPEDEEKKQKKIVAYVSNGIWSANEGRNVDGTYGPHNDPKADELQAMNVPGEVARDTERAGKPEPSREPKETKE
jgi:HK97 family phage portal protein